MIPKESDGVRTQILQTPTGLELRTMLRAEELLNAGMGEAIRKEIIIKCAETVCKDHLAEIVKRVDFQGIAKELVNAIDFRKLQSEVAAKVASQCFDEKAQEIIEGLNMQAIANMVAAYTARLVSDSITLLPKSVPHG